MDIRMKAMEERYELRIAYLQRYLALSGQSPPHIDGLLERHHSAIVSTPIDARGSVDGGIPIYQTPFSPDPEQLHHVMTDVQMLRLVPTLSLMAMAERYRKFTPNQGPGPSPLDPAVPPNPS